MKLDLKAPHTVYKRSDGTRLAGVTTILGVLEKAALRGWYASMEREGILAIAKANPLSLFASLGPMLPAKWFAEAKRDKAADLGTVTHARCEAWLLKDELEPDGIPPETFEQSLHGLKRFQEEWLSRGLTLLHSERQLIYDDGKMAFGGTADLIVRRTDGKIGVIDLKTTKASPLWPYDEVFGQTEAYAQAAGNDPQTALDIEWTEMWRIGKEAGDEMQTHPTTPKERAVGWRLFQAAYAAYEAKRELAKR